MKRFARLRLRRPAPPPVYPDARTWRVWEHQGIGDTIEYHHRKDYTLVFIGWTTPRIKVGDIIECETVMDRIAIHRVITARPQYNTDDMWFADCERIGTREQR